LGHNRPVPKWKCGQHVFEPDKTLVMGVINVTPDSFYDGGRHNSTDRAVSLALSMLSEGADILDIGGESTRPGSEGVAAEIEIARVVPVIEALSKLKPNAVISVDTSKADVAAESIAAGASIVNDVSACSDPQMIPLLASTACGYIAMHMLGVPRTMQSNPDYKDVVKEVAEYLQDRLDVLVSCGVAAERIALDPGIGFGKLLGHNIELIKAIPKFAALGRPVVIGASRKSMIGALTGAAPDDRLAGSIAVAVAASKLGAHVIRVHDVKATVDALKVARAIWG